MKNKLFVGMPRYIVYVLLTRAMKAVVQSEHRMRLNSLIFSSHGDKLPHKRYDFQNVSQGCVTMSKNRGRITHLACRRI